MRTVRNEIVDVTNDARMRSRGARDISAGRVERIATVIKAVVDVTEL